MTEAILSLGGNLGNREQTLREASAEISALKQVELVQTSSFYETVALTLAGEDENAPKFLNCVIKIDTKACADLNSVDEFHREDRPQFEFLDGVAGFGSGEIDLGFDDAGQEYVRVLVNEIE